jgi:hypothetical protein
MQNLHDDKNLDELSRQAAEACEPDPDLHSWESLRPALDVALPQKKEKKRRFLLLFLLFLLVGGGIVFSTIWNKREQAESKPAIKPEATSNTATPAAQDAGAKTTGNKAQLPEASTNENVTAVPAPVAEAQAPGKRETTTPSNNASSNNIETANTGGSTVNKKLPPANEQTVTNKLVTTNRSTVANRSTRSASTSSQISTSSRIKNNNSRQPQTGNKTMDYSTPVANLKTASARLDENKTDPVINIAAPGRSSLDNILQHSLQLPTDEAMPTVKKAKAKQSTPLKNR